MSALPLATKGMQGVHICIYTIYTSYMQVHPVDMGFMESLSMDIPLSAVLQESIPITIHPRISGTPEIISKSWNSGGPENSIFRGYWE